MAKVYTSGVIFFLLLSFLRGVFSSLVGHVLPLYGVVGTLLLLATPVIFPSVDYIGKRWRITTRGQSPELTPNQSLVLNILLIVLWGVAMIIEGTALVFWFSILGIGAVLVHLKEMDPRGWTIAVLLDLLVRFANGGQEPIFQLNTASLPSVYIFVLLLMVMWEARENDQRGPHLNPIVSLQLMFAYMLVPANNGILLPLGGWAPITHMIIVIFSTMIISKISIEPKYQMVFVPLILFMYRWNILWGILLIPFLITLPPGSSNIQKVIGGYILLLLSILSVFLTEQIWILAVVIFLSGIHIPKRVPSTTLHIKIPRNGYRIFISLALVSLLLNPILVSPDIPRDRAGLVVLDYNLHFGLTSAGRDSFQDLVELVRKENPDVITLQEVVVNSPLNGFRNMYIDLSEGLKQMGFWFSAISDGSYTTRNAIFSKYPIVESTTILIEPVVQYQRSAVLASIMINGKPVITVSTHLTNIGPSSGTTDRLRQVDMLVKKTREFASGVPVIVAGDFNAVPESPEYDRITTFFTDTWMVNGTEGPTSPADFPRKRIDYIFSTGLELDSCYTIATLISDHLPLICTFEE